MPVPFPDQPLNRRHFTLLAVGCVAVGLSVASSLAKANQSPKILVVGDSLSAEYGLSRGKGWVNLLQQRLAAQGSAATVVNASISGDTTSGGRARLATLLAQHRPTHVIIELGGNDALRGLALSMTQANLTEMTKAAQAAGAKVLLLGMQVPPNYGAAYTRDFQQVFVQVARNNHAALVPFLLQGVADRADADAWFQGDRIHPREQAHPIILDNVWAQLRPLLK